SMNVLAQIIPGIRETRTPLVVGILWVGVAWVLSFLVPRHVWQFDALNTPIHQIQRLPTEVVVSITLLLIYIFGVILDFVGAFIRKVIRLAFLLIGLAGFVPLAVLLIRSWQGWLLAALIISMYLRLEVSRQRRREPGKPFLEVLE